ncbi:MAG TPA: MarR family winged helix-turn-helix transcriptional regulator [Actinomycetaceae bacterium]|nr:MarR family winged helix-turn-helix transcriptional regulator [Actinomycetaceae bacterium]
MASQDEVDRIIAAWRAQRPDLDLEPLQVFSRVSRLSRQLEIARRYAFTTSKLETWEFDVLSALRRAGAPFELTPGRLVEETLVSSGTMTNRIDRLVAKRLVTREADPSDRRVVRVRLSAAGKTAVDTAMAHLLDFERELLAPLPDGRRDDLAASLRDLLMQFDDATAAPRGPGFSPDAPTAPATRLRVPPDAIEAPSAQP